MEIRKLVQFQLENLWDVIGLENEIHIVTAM